ncbi:flagellin N-terminal helical domain-containing protein [Vreelandella zhanjiangensis]|uniref:flagellin N-terminal helical domain-containing protein n=1 Tax=Vreelandella zhanjiangensis TaxID=1121960 RepID=UPI0003666884|nr:flagellin [Halomonas zhanjiangensis]
MAVINTNLMALTGQNNRLKTINNIEAAMQRLSSGLRVNGAKDDAAGQAIANRMESNVRANHQTIKGLNNGISLMQTAEGGLDNINSLLHRANALAVQAASETLSDNDRAAINGEYLELRSEIDRIALSTEAFGKTPLAPVTPDPSPAKLGNTEHIAVKLDGVSQSFTSGIVPVAYIPAGATNVRIEMDSLSADDDMQLFTLDGRHLVGTPIIETDDSPTDHVWASRGISDVETANKFLTEENGFQPGASYDASSFADATGKYDVAMPPVDQEYAGMQITYSGDRDRAFNSDEENTSFNDGNLGAVDSAEWVEVITIDATTEPLMLLIVGQGAFYAKATWDEMPIELIEPAPSSTPTSQATKIVTGAAFGQAVSKLTIAPTPADYRSLGLEGVELDPVERAREALAHLHDAFSQIDTYRSHYGAMQNRFEGAVAGYEQSSIALQAAQSRIMDADYAEESARLLKVKILQEAGDSMLAQANQSSQSVLDLLSL